MGMQVLRDGAGSTIIKYILLSFLVLAMGGLVFTDVGGFFRDGIGTNDVAVVGDESISIVTFDNTVRRQLGNSKVTPAMAYQIGYIDQILNNEINSHLLIQAAQDSGIKISAKKLATYIREMMQNFSSPDEKPSAALERMLLNWGLSEQRFLKTIERSIAQEYLTQTLRAGFAETSDQLLADLYSHQNEERTIQLVNFEHKKFLDFQEPTAERTERYYNANKAQYTIPEQRDITLITINQDKIKSAAIIEEEEIRAAYEDNMDAYTTPAKREIEQALFATQDDAKAAYEKIQNGTDFKTASASAENVTEATNLAQDELMSGLGKPAFANKDNSTLEPIKTTLGWHILKVGKKTDAIITPYDNAKADIKKLLIEEQVAEQVALLADQLDDALAGGAQPEEIKENFDITLSTIKGISIQNTSALSKYGEDEKNITSSAFELFESESSPVFETKTGDLMAVSLISITPQSYKPYDSVKDDIRKQLRDDAQKKTNIEAVQKYLQDLEDKNDNNLDAFAKNQNRYLQTVKAIKRSGDVKEPLTRESLNTVFETNKNGLAIITTDNGIALIKVTGSKLLDPQDAKGDNLLDLEVSTLQNMQEEALQLFVKRERNKRGVKINKQRLESAYAQQQE